MKQAPEEGAAGKARIERELKKAEAAIERLLDRLEGEEAGDALMARLKAREAERAALRQELTATVTPETVVIPTPAELEAIYCTQVARLEALLTGSDQTVAANALLRELLGEVRVWRDPDALDGMRVEIRGEASRMFQGAGGTAKASREGGL